ncbi:nudix hydrolase 19, chloroplastic-like [Gastrolobium bilobum]|uniref:nudix hydrolase 19, chloroplastic-like n=1 Tax=Gastrolobium bilobum TaxID=150636 RepID=UPI002AAF9C22|nr:nudix hydrolase 19, chloroplastic-like [Gastrolobium bilobum]
MLKFLNISSSSKIFSIFSLSKELVHQSPPLSTPFYQHKASFPLTTMSINLQSHAFVGNPLRSKTPNPGDPFSPTAAFETLKSRILENTHSSLSPNFKVLPFRNGRPLASSMGGQSWHLGWISLGELKGLLSAELNGDSLVYLGSDTEEDSVYWAIDVSGEPGLVAELGSMKLCFVELRTLMVATDWVDLKAMGNLAIAGHARALLEWHNISHFCGHCGEKTVPMEAGRRKQCSNESCKKRIYPRVDPVVIMLVIDRENDRALLSKQSRFVPRMWSCLAGFIEPGESLEEAVRRETWEETGIEVGEVVYHSSQPWPVGPNSMPCQLMVGFFAYAKSLEINVDKEELEDAQWHSRDDVRKALTFAEYKKAQRTAAAKVEQMCKGVEKTHSLATDFNVESGELAPMFVPGPFAIAHHLISSWAFPDQSVNGIECHSKEPSGSMSNL